MQWARTLHETSGTATSSTEKAFRRTGEEREVSFPKTSLLGSSVFTFIPSDASLSNCVNGSYKAGRAAKKQLSMDSNWVSQCHCPRPVLTLYMLSK